MVADKVESASLALDVATAPSLPVEEGFALSVVDSASFELLVASLWTASDGRTSFCSLPGFAGVLGFALCIGASLPVGGCEDDEGPTELVKTEPEVNVRLGCGIPGVSTRRTVLLVHPLVLMTSAFTADVDAVASLPPSLCG